VANHLVVGHLPNQPFPLLQAQTTQSQLAVVELAQHRTRMVAKAAIQFLALLHLLAVVVVVGVLPLLIGMVDLVVVSHQV
jgi:hypothetical protein